MFVKESFELLFFFPTAFNLESHPSLPAVWSVLVCKLFGLIYSTLGLPWLVGKVGEMVVVAMTAGGGSPCVCF